VLANPDIAARIDSIILHVTQLSDRLTWAHPADGLLFAKQDFSFLRPEAVTLHWAYMIWKHCIPPSLSFVFFLVHYA